MSIHVHMKGAEAGDVRVERKKYQFYSLSEIDAILLLDYKLT